VRGSKEGCGDYRDKREWTVAGDRHARIQARIRSFVHSFVHMVRDT